MNMQRAAVAAACRLAADDWPRFVRAIGGLPPTPIEIALVRETGKARGATHIAVDRAEKTAKRETELPRHPMTERERRRRKRLRDQVYYHATLARRAELLRPAP